MKKLFHKIYWNQANLTWKAAGETCASVYAKTGGFDNEELRPFIWLQPIDIGLKQRLMKYGTECIDSLKFQLSLKRKKKKKMTFYAFLFFENIYYYKSFSAWTGKGIVVHSSCPRRINRL